MKISKFTISSLKFLVPFVLIFPSLALAVDDATVQAIDSKASSAKSKADGNNSRIQALEAADQILNNRIDNIQLTPGPAGPQGPAGPAGAEGVAGADGAQGPAGPQGPAGADGVAGADGAQGPAGPQGGIGPIGLTGATGATGAQGIQGEQGPQGIQGESGPQGPQGIQGDVGPIGLTGPAGTQGADGAQGPAGPQGPAGATGPQGLAGADGAQGPAGADGAEGPQGPQGPAGADGVAGPPGPPGPDLDTLTDLSPFCQENDVAKWNGTFWDCAPGSSFGSSLVTVDRLVTLDWPISAEEIISCPLGYYVVSGGYLIIDYGAIAGGDQRWVVTASISTSGDYLSASLPENSWYVAWDLIGDPDSGNFLERNPQILVSVTCTP